MLPVPIETLRVRVGLDSSDASQDTEITSASDTALALMGNYCDRYFDQMVDAVESFTHIYDCTVPLKRYPIVSVASAVDENGTDFKDYHISAEQGLLKLDVYRAFHTLKVTFTGGYAEGEFPSDLLAAYYTIFDQEFAAADGGSSSDTIASVSVLDVGTVRYRDDSADFHDPGVAYIPVSAAAILDNFKRFRC